MSYVIAVDDDPEVLSTLGRVLKREKLDYNLAKSGVRALELIKSRRPDLLILDIIMPEMDGLTVCKRIRQNPNYITLPILFLTAKGSTDDVVKGFDVGGDDYVIKPFELLELRARIRALLRRTNYKQADTESVLHVGDVELDSNSYQVYVKDQAIQLTQMQHRLLRYMMQHSEEILTLSQLLVDVWEYPLETGDPDLVRAHIRNLRGKVEKNPEHQYIRTVHGVGYVFNKNS